MSEPIIYLRSKETALRLGITVRRLINEVDGAPAPDAFFDDTPGWLESTATGGRSTAPAQRYLTLRSAAAVTHRALGTLEKYRRDGKFIEPAALLIPKPQYGYASVDARLWGMRQDGRGRPVGAIARPPAGGPNTIIYLIAREVAEAMNVERTAFRRLVEAGELPRHAAVIGELKVWETRAAQGRWPEGDPIRYLSPPQAARELGISTLTFRKAVDNGRVPPPDARAGSRYGWLPQSVDRRPEL